MDRKKLQKASLGMHDSDDEDGGKDIDQQISDMFAEKKAIREVGGAAITPKVFCPGLSGRVLTFYRSAYIHSIVYTNRFNFILLFFVTNRQSSGGHSAGGSRCSEEPERGSRRCQQGQARQGKGTRGEAQHHAETSRGC